MHHEVWREFLAWLRALPTVLLLLATSPCLWRSVPLALQLARAGNGAVYTVRSPYPRIFATLNSWYWGVFRLVFHK